MLDHLAAARAADKTVVHLQSRAAVSQWIATI
jgi:hypothetical protein